MDLHPRLVYDPMEMDSGLDRVKFAPQDFWLRFNPGGVPPHITDRAVRNPLWREPDFGSTATVHTPH